MIKLIAILTILKFVSSIVLTRETLLKEWTNFKAVYNKSYNTLAEESLREDIFAKKLQQIIQHNGRFLQGLETYEMGVNRFTDFTEEEMRPYTHGVRLPEVMPQSAEIFTGHPINIPANIDWRDYGVVTPIKDQAGCGACWAFAVVGALEAQMKIVHGTDSDVSLSEQQLIDCSYSTRGCDGGWPNTAYEYILLSGGVESDREYPYEEKEGNCRFEPGKVAAKMKAYGYLPAVDENAMAQLVYQYGPVAATVDASGGFGSYSNGVYYDPDCRDSGS